MVLFFFSHSYNFYSLYKPKYLIMMVVATWVSGFGALAMTWLEQWGRFGLDPDIGSCSILPDINGRSPKEFLFILAFLAPCIAIIVCYARIFYIVRKTAHKSRRHEKIATDLIESTLEVYILIIYILHLFLSSPSPIPPPPLLLFILIFSICCNIVNDSMHLFIFFPVIIRLIFSGKV